MPIPVLYDFIFERYGWTEAELGECSGNLFDELQQVWIALGEATATPGPKVAETHDELVAQARAQGFSLTPEEYEQEMTGAGGI